MLRSLSRGITTLALTLIWMAVVWLVIDILFADPAVLVFEDIAILCAVVAPLLYLVGWALHAFAFRTNGRLRKAA